MPALDVAHCCPPVRSQATDAGTLALLVATVLRPVWLHTIGPAGAFQPWCPLDITDGIRDTVVR